MYKYQIFFYSRAMAEDIYFNKQSTHKVGALNKRLKYISFNFKSILRI